ncbi:solute carrier family 2, facilitated glucose transporter member 1-like [Symsagittifera roscoffensis]|uniref:solute carrier family 2, facilitated glucose transporter member 1-like n=1 Tax=Symsagittifera roscoffensis TaxID=84072 RepID=UPI00307B8E84
MPKRSFSCSMQSNDEGQFLINNLKDSKDSGKQTGPRKGAQEGSWTPTLCLSAFSAVIGAALPMGYNNGVLNTPEDIIKNFFNQSHLREHDTPFKPDNLNFMWNLTVASYCLGAPLGCLFGSWIAERIGRKSSLLYLNILLVVGGLYQVVCSEAGFNRYQLFIAGRVINGFKDGAACVVCPMYLSEIAPNKIRGGIGLMFQLAVVFGTLLASLLGCEICLGTENRWPFLFDVLLGFGCLQCILLSLCPESPRFILIKQGNAVLCESELRRLRGDGCDLAAEMHEIIDEDKKLKSEPTRTLKDFFLIRSLRKPLILACFMSLSQQLSGINSMATFSGSIFKAALSSQVQKKSDLKNYMVVAMWGVSFLFTLVAVPLVDRAGRKVSHLTGLIGMTACSLVVSFLLSDLRTSDDQNCPGINLDKYPWTNYLSVTLLFIYLIFFAIGPSCVPWMLTPELFTVGTVSTAASIAGIVNWLANFSVQFGFGTLLDYLCGWVFLIFVGFMSFFIVYLKIHLPETKGMAITEIVALFE